MYKRQAHSTVDLYPAEQGVPLMGYLPGDILDYLGDVIQINGDLIEEMTPEVREASNTLYRLRENNEAVSYTHLDVYKRQ